MTSFFCLKVKTGSHVNTFGFGVLFGLVCV